MKANPKNRRCLPDDLPDRAPSDGETSLVGMAARLRATRFFIATYGALARGLYGFRELILPAGDRS